MNEKIKDLITYENITSYSDACISLNETLIDKQEEHDLLIIPSRGAYPFYRYAQYSSYSLGSIKEVMKLNSHYKTWLLPYTADWGNLDIPADSQKIRTFWSKVLYDTIQKEKTPYTRFYKSMVTVLKNELTFNPTNCELNIPKKKSKFIFMDTAISGRAICHILKSFDELNITGYFVILIVQNNGNDLRKKYREVIECKASQGKLKLIKVAEIFSEDASPLLNGGISSMVFPSLIERACNEIKEFKNNQYCGSGLWFIDSASHLYNSKLNSVRGILHTLINSGLRANFNEDNSDQFLKKSTESLAQKIIENAGDFNLFDPESTKLLIRNRILSKNVSFENEIAVSGSHVVRMTLNNNLISEIIKRT